MCTYNGERFLGKQIASILGQSRPVDEIIVCDDASADSTIEILTGYATQQSKIKVVKNPERLGYRKNFEQAIGLATGEWVFLSDQDDIWHPTKVQRYCDLIEGSGTDLGIVFGNATLIDDNDRQLGTDLLNAAIKNKIPNRNQELRPRHVLKLLERGNFVTGATMALRREKASLGGPFPAPYVHDFWLTLIYAMTGSALYYFQDCLTSYRIHQGQTVGLILDRPDARTVSEPARGPHSKHIDLEGIRFENVVLSHFRGRQEFLNGDGRGLLARAVRKVAAHRSMRLHERILRIDRTKRTRWVVRYLVTGRYARWETHHPKFLFGLARAVFDCLRT